MGIISKEEAMKYITEEVTQIIFNSINSSIDEYKEKYKELKYKHSSRTDSSIIHDLIKHNVMMNFSGRTDIHYATKRNCFRLLVGNDDIGRYFVIRFKKMNKLFLANRNIPKLKETGFEQLTFLNPCTDLNAGYFMDGLNNPKILLTCPSSTKNNEWEWELEHSKGTEVIKFQQEEIQQNTRKPKPKGKRLEENAT